MCKTSNLDALQKFMNFGVDLNPQLIQKQKQNNLNQIGYCLDTCRPARRLRRADRPCHRPDQEPPRRLLASRMPRPIRRHGRTRLCPLYLSRL